MNNSVKPNNALNGGLTPSNTTKNTYNTNRGKPHKFVYPSEKLKEFKAKKYG